MSCADAACSPVGHSTSNSVFNASIGSKIMSPNTLMLGVDEDELELRYDPLLNCYFDPATNKYYELAH